MLFCSTQWVWPFVGMQDRCLNGKLAPGNAHGWSVSSIENLGCCESVRNILCCRLVAFIFDNVISNQTQEFVFTLWPAGIQDPIKFRKKVFQNIVSVSSHPHAYVFSHLTNLIQKLQQTANHTWKKQEFYHTGSPQWGYLLFCTSVRWLRPKLFQEPLTTSYNLTVTMR